MKIPNNEYYNCPCAQVAISCAVGYKINIETSKKNGYTTLADQNKYIRKYLNVDKSLSFKRGERPLLKDLIKGESRRAIICVYGHYVYYDGTDYWSFFDNDNDEVVRVWYVK